MLDQFFLQMTAFELADLQATYWDLGLSLVTIYISTLFAYILASEFIISRVSLGQLVAISVLYSLFLLFIIASYYGVQSTMFIIQLHIIEQSSIAYEGSFTQATSPAIILFVGWITSILYMIFAWRKK